MRRIEKGQEPAAWTRHRLTPGAVYEPSEALRESLLKEQGYICAYCMRRIPVKDGNSNETSRIEHILCRERHADLQLDYRNMVICCPGAIDGTFHCDKSKGNRDITFDLSQQRCMDTLSYGSGDGTIRSSDNTYDRELNDVLNLNHALLKKNRSMTLKGVINRLNQRHSWKKSQIRTLLNEWDSKDGDGYYKPYNGIVVWFLKKKLEQK